jgi:penicillin-binding protein 1A
VGGFDGRDIAGKTGTVENWGDAWAVGFTPQIVTAVWFGFDSPGNSLGRNQTGARAAGPAWAEFMKAAHQELPVEEFSRPKEGIKEVTVCLESGLLPHPEGFCDDLTYEEVFLEGTEPSRFCDIHGTGRFDMDERVDTLRKLVTGADLSFPEIPTFELEAPFFFEEDLDFGGTAQGNPLLD